MHTINKIIHTKIKNDFEENYMRILVQIFYLTLCICLSFSLHATTQNKPTFIQTLKKDWKKVAIITTGVLAIVGTAVASFAGWRKYKWSHMSPFDKSKHLPTSTLPLEPQHTNVSPGEKYVIVERIKSIMTELHIQGWTIGTDDDVNIFNQPQYPPYNLLGWAVIHGNVELTELLLRAGAKVNEGTSGEGHTPLTKALTGYFESQDAITKQAYYRIMELLLQYGGILHNNNSLPDAMNLRPEIYDLFTKYGYRGDSRLYRKKVGSKIEIHSYYENS